MFCSSCGANIANDTLSACPYCGKPLRGRAPASPTQPPVAPRAAETPVYPTTWQEDDAKGAGGGNQAGGGYAGGNYSGGSAGGNYGGGYNAGGSYRGRMIASMVLGILSLIIAWFGWGALVSIILAIVGLCLGVSGKKAAPVGAPTGMAVAGIVCSVIGLFLSSIVFVSCVLCAAAAGTAGLLSY